LANTTRTFIAVAVPDSAGHKLTRLQTLLAPDLPGTRWTATLPFHLTLAFLGDVADTDLNEVCLAAAKAAAPLAPFELRIEGLGAFPQPTRPRVIWVGVTGPGVEALAILQKSLVDAVRRVGYLPDEERFHPHVSLGRVKSGRPRGPSPDMTPLVRHYATWSPGSLRVAEAVVFASTLTPEGPVYAPLGRAPLAGGNPAPNA
jgi:2'-5' RNA ligase